jgi:hypothetical protein
LGEFGFVINRSKTEKAGKEQTWLGFTISRGLIQVTDLYKRKIAEVIDNAIG